MTLVLPEEPAFATSSSAYMLSETEDQTLDIYEFGSEQGLSLEEVTALTQIDLKPLEFRGVITLGGQEIAFGGFNEGQESGQAFVHRMKSSVADTIRHATGSAMITNDQLQAGLSQLKVKLFSFESKKDKIDFHTKALTDHSNQLRKHHSDLKIARINKAERKQVLERMKQSNSQAGDHEAVVEAVQTGTLTKQDLMTSKNKKQATAAPSGASISIEAVGGPAYNYGACDPTSENPRCGDGQDRLRQKAGFHASGSTYDWLPYWVGGEVREIDTSNHRREVRVDWQWDATGLSNLRVDSNEAIEAEVLFYNYGAGAGIPEQGMAYMWSYPTYWTSNLPGGYQDTRFGDDGRDISFAVGTASTGSLSAGVKYYFIMQGFAESNSHYNLVTPTKGLYLIDFQRGYWFDSQNEPYRLVRGTGTEWYVFNEEYETSAKIKHYHKYDTAYYAPGIFSEFTAETFQNQFRYKEGFTLLSNGASVTTPSLSSGNYAVYKLQVNSPASWKIATSKYGTTSSDTYLKLYDHRFKEIASNDDANGTLYSEISKYLSNGDYYVVVHGYNYGSMRSYLTATQQ